MKSSQVKSDFRCTRLLLPAFLAFFPSVTLAASEPKPVGNDMGGLSDLAFGGIWNGNLEDAEVEPDVRDALDQGLGVDARDEFGDTLLLNAIENDRSSIIRLLLVRGAGINISDSKLGDTPLIRASYSDGTILGIAKSRYGKIKFLLSKGADPNRRNKEGKSALMLASLRGYEEIVAVLLKAGANPNLRDNNLETALTLAADYGRSNIVAALLKAGADFRLKNRRGVTALRLTSESVPGRSNNVVYSMPMPSSGDPKQIEKETIANQKMIDRMVEKEIKRSIWGRAAARKLLKAAGAKE